MAIIDLITLLQRNLPLILPVSLNLVLIFLGVRQARAGTHFNSNSRYPRVREPRVLKPSSTECGTSQPRPQVTRFERPTIRELEDLMDPPGWTGRRFYKINRHIRLFIKMLTDLENHSITLQRLSPTLIDE